MKSIAAILMILFTACKSQMHFEGSNMPIVVDGNKKEWPELRAYDANSKILYGLFTHDTYVYLVLETPDPETQQKILMTGLTVYVNGHGKKSKNQGIKFPLISVIPTDVFASKKVYNRSSEITKRIDGNNRQAELIGFARGRSTFINLDKYSVGIQAKIGYHQSTQSLIYEMGIPLVLLNNKREPKEIMIGIETGEPFDGSKRFTTLNNTASRLADSPAPTLLTTNTILIWTSINTHYEKTD